MKSNKAWHLNWQRYCARYLRYRKLGMRLELDNSKNYKYERIPTYCLHMYIHTHFIIIDIKSRMKQ